MRTTVSVTTMAIEHGVGELRSSWGWHLRREADHGARGNGGGAHRELEEGLGLLVDDLGQTNRPAASRMPEVEEDGGDGGAGLSATCSSMERARASRRSSGMRWRGSGMVVVVVVLVDGVGCARARAGRE